MLDWKNQLSTAESVIATNFRRQVAELMDRPQLLLREFQRFSNVLQRPSIAQVPPSPPHPPVPAFPQASILVDGGG